MKLKKRIVGFLLLFGIVLVIIPLFFGRSIPVEELKLSGKIPAAPAKPKDISMPIPPQSTTMPEKMVPLEIKPLPSKSIEPASPAASMDAKKPVAVSQAQPAPVQLQPAVPPVPQNVPPQNSLPSNTTDIAVPLVPPVEASTAAVPFMPEEATFPEAVLPVVAPAPAASNAPATKSPSPVLAKNTPVSTGVEKKAKLATTKNAPKKTGSAAVVAAPGKEKWVVQLGTFVKKTNAENLTKKLKAQALVAYMEPIKTTSGRYITKVFVGPYPDRNNAAQLRTRIQKEFNVEGVLIKAG